MTQRLQRYFFDKILPLWFEASTSVEPVHIPNTKIPFPQRPSGRLHPRAAEQQTGSGAAQSAAIPSFIAAQSAVSSGAPCGATPYLHPYQIPRLQKIVLNRGLGDASQNTKILESSLQEFQKITGQKALIQYSRKSIAGFHLRRKMPVGIAVTLRRNFMYGFLDRLIHLALPRIRDFPGLSLKSFDGCGNYNFGLDEQLMFPEIHYDNIQQIRGMDISIVTTAKTDKESLTLLQAFGMPFQKSDKI